MELRFVMEFIQSLTRHADAGELVLGPDGTVYHLVIGCWVRDGKVCSLRGVVVGLMAACSLFGTTLLSLPFPPSRVREPDRNL